MNIYFVKFNNYSIREGTAQLHYEVLKEHGKVIWGQWTNSGQLLSSGKYDEMNFAEFMFYALDRSEALLKMRVSRVMRKEEVIDQKLEHLIPKYYGIEQPCSAYYLVEDIVVEPVKYAESVVSRSGKSVLSSGSLNSAAPWLVKDNNSMETLCTILKKESAAMPSEEVDAERTYVVYRYRNRANGKSYIGQTIDIQRRRKEHENPTSWRNSKKYLYTIFAIQGIDTMDFSILYEGLSKKEADYFEAKEIELHDSYYPNGLNERVEKRHLIMEEELLSENYQLINKIFDRIKIDLKKPE